MPSNPLSSAEMILSGKEPIPSLSEIENLSKALSYEQQFSIARQLLALAAQGRAKTEHENLISTALEARHAGPSHEQNKHTQNPLLWLIQQQALFTYKDQTLSLAERTSRALSILDQIGLPNPQLKNSTTLALAGAVFKRAWDHDGLSDDLNLALEYYKAGWERNHNDPDSCYCADQAAFIYDQLAFRVETTSRCMPTGEGDVATSNVSLNQRAQVYRQAAKDLRSAALDQLQLRQHNWPEAFTANGYWLITHANLQLGLALADSRLLASATASFEKVAAANLGTTGGDLLIQEVYKQAMALTRLHHYLPPESDKPQEDHTNSTSKNWEQVKPIFFALLGTDTHAAHTYHRGKVGLALSGGGFRAALYHLGVMARMAEVDALRGVEVLSTVSGGSVVGAFYYLELQQLLESKSDRALKKADFIDLMHKVHTQFLLGVQRNVGVRVSSSLTANFKMIRKDYSNSYRIGELYEKEIYSRAGKYSPGQVRSMPDLMIRPAEKPDFKPRFDNWRRTNKVPVLLLNTTSFNTGHNWHFTASWMGEPPGLLKNNVDATERYRRLYYHQAPLEQLRKFRLGHAVAASSCVPGIFEAIAIRGLYPGRIVHLFDGGVHDNQGLAGLLDEGCTRILCSDASGQMNEDKMPTQSMLGVPLRANAILQNRIRDVQYQDVRVRTDTQSLQGLFFIHLRQCLETAKVDWVGCPDPSAPPSSDSALLPYGIDRDIQKKIAAIRTDLDSFTEVEAYALLCSGYLSAEYEFKTLQARHRQQGLPGTWGGYQIDAPRGDWPFLQLEPIMRRPPDPQDEQRQELGKQLAVSSILYFKIWHLNPVLQLIAKMAGLGILAGLVYFLIVQWSSPIAPWIGQLTWGMAILLILVLGMMAVLNPIQQIIAPKTSGQSWIYKSVFAVLAAVIAKTHLAIFEKMYLKQGKIARLLKMKGKP